MTSRLFIAVLIALVLELVATGYGAVAAAHEAHVSCTQDRGVVQGGECVKAGHDLFSIPW